MSAERYISLRTDFEILTERAFREISHIMRTERAGELRKIFDEIYKDLSLNAEYDGNIYDIVIIPGARTVFRAKKANELYQGGLVKKVYLTGNYPYYVEKNKKNMVICLKLKQWPFICMIKLNRMFPRKT